MKLVTGGIFLLIVSLGFAQEYRASIAGTITDPSGRPIEDAKVRVLGTERNVAYDTVSNAEGRYNLLFLLPGRYRVSIEKEGFKRFVSEGVHLYGADKLALDARLDIGVLTESVTATAAAPGLQTESATRQTTLENRVLENVPAGGRNLFALQYNQPGVVKTSTYWGTMELYAFGNMNAVSIGGGRQGENETVLDGLSNTKSDRGVAFVPALAATQEFTVQTNSYDAQFGRVGGGVTMINLKSGTNALHGQLYEYFKNDKLRANDWIANKNRISRVPYKNNTFGVELDGPVFLPKIFDGRNRAFFMISYEGLREHNPGGQVTTVPTAEMLRGDFSGLRNANGDSILIYDPLSTRLGPDGRTFLRTPFPGNLIPAGRINAVASKVASFYPAPTVPGNGPSQLNNYQKISAQTNGYDSWTGKLDLVPTEKSRFWFRYGQTPWLNFAGLVWGNNAAEPSNQYPSTRVPRNWGADWTYALTPRVMLNLRGGLARYEAFTGNSFGVNYDPRQLGFADSLVTQFRKLVFPRFNIAGYSALGAQSVSRYITQDTWSLQPNISLTAGRHMLRIGAEFRRYSDNDSNPGLASGSYTFDASWTQANPQRADSSSGNAFASFLLGLPGNGFVDRAIDTAYRSQYHALYVHDDFKVTSRFVLNIGARWDYESPRRERFNRMVRGFGFDQPSPIAASVLPSTAAANCPACSAGLKGGLLYATPEEAGRLAFIPHKANFQPRVGVAYRVSSKIVFRGGYGLSYLGQSANGPATGFSRQTPLVASLDNGLTPAASLSDPFPASIYPTGLLQPVGNTQGLATNLGQNITFQYLDRPLPYSQQYSAGFQWELAQGWLLEASYAGNATKRLPVTLGINFLPLNDLNSIPVNQRQAYFNQQVTNPMAGLLPNSGLNGATVARQQLLFAFPQYGSGSQMTDVPIGRQRYDSLQLKASHRFTRGLALTVSYTVSKTLEQVSVLNPQDVNLANPLQSKLERRLIQFDVPRQLSVIGTYDLPFGAHRRYRSSGTRWINGLLGDWSVSGVFMSHAGFPLPFPNAASLGARSAALSDAQRDALAQAAGRSQYDPSSDVWFDTSLFPRVAQAPFTLRTFPTRFPDVRGKPLNVVDLSLYKEFRGAERVRWQIRADIHNAGNFPWFASLDPAGNNVASPLFGHLRADMGNETRIVVGVLKVIF